MRRIPLFLALALAVHPAAARAENPFVRITTTVGSFVVELCQEVSDRCAGDAPNTVANFLSYVDGDHYPPTTILDKHNPDPNYVQGGALYGSHDDQGYFIDFLPTAGVVARELDERLSNLRGSMSMIYEPDIGGSANWWFLNLADNPSLDTEGGGYAVFGEVAAGMDVVDAIGAVPVYPAYLYGNLPLVDYPGEPTPVVPYLIFVTSIERMPEPGLAAGLLVALGTLATLGRRAYPAEP
jgi:peptidyl-prolyl cis-trans isomerase A (cyclophilin A)